MDLIISTPQGEAEISVNAVHDSVTVGDLLGRVLNSAPPAIVYIDGRSTPVETLMSAAGLITGSVIDVGAPRERPVDGATTLVQAAGEGGGNRRPLGPGRYSLGTARRANVAPLTLNQVLVPRCEVVVELSGKVTIAADHGDLDGYRATTPALWEQQRLRIGHRVFRLDSSGHDRATSLLPTASGRINFTPTQRAEATADCEPVGRTRRGGRLLRGRRKNRVEEPQPSSMASGEPARFAWDSDLNDLRRAHLDLAEVIRRALQLSERLWERRPTDDDAFVFSVGLADQRWVPTDAHHFDDHDLAMLPSVPVLVDLANERGIGFASTPPQARAAARALVLQACVANSPADLDVVVLATPAGAGRWEWIKWLPHARSSHGVQLLSDDDAIADWVRAQRILTTAALSVQPFGRAIKPSRLTLAVIDDPALWRGQAATLRWLFTEAQLPVRFVALTDRADDVPAVCTTVVRIETNGAAEVDHLIRRSMTAEVIPFVLDHDVAVAAARKLSPLEDHGAQRITQANLPTLVPLASLIDPDGLDAGRIVEHWTASRTATGRLRAAIGTGESGRIHLDLVEDGPHVLIIGAQQSGKTELIRTIIASLIAVAEPSALNVMFVDPSDGSSFAAFAGVDHLVGAVNRFDEHSGVRLLRALRSEVSMRERMLAESPASLADHQAASDDRARVLIGGSGDDVAAPPISRLVIAIDDADDVMTRHPAFLPQLIELAVRSRHLGLHLVVAARHLPRPIEHTFDNFANIRIGLRMNDSAEAIAVLGSEPAPISSRTPGRGALRIGESAPLQVQFASASSESDDLIEIAPFVVARDLNAAESRIKSRSAKNRANPHRKGGLGHLIDVVGEASAMNAGGRQRPVLCRELPTDLPYEQIFAPQANTPEAEGAAFALSDLPDDRTQSNRRWDPTRDGNILIVGGSPNERSQALATLFLAATDRFPTDQLHGYVIDCTAVLPSRLEALELLTACGAVASIEDLDRVLRVLIRLAAELDRRAGLDETSTEPHIVLVVNDGGSLVRSLELGGAFEQGRDLFDRLVGRGPLYGITMLMTLASEHAAPAQLLGHFQQRIILHLDDRSAYEALGIEPGRIPVRVPGRAITAPDLIEIQIASIGDLDAAVVQRRNRPYATHGPVSVARTVPNASRSELSTASDDAEEAP